MELRVSVDVETLCGSELIDCMKSIERVQTELDALRIALVRQADEQREAELDGLRSAAAWVEKHTGVPAQTTREQLRVADRLEHLPIVAKWFEAGDICYSKVRALTAAWSPDTAAAMARDEQLLVDRSGDLNVRDFTRLMRYWKVCADPDDRNPDRQWEQRRAYLSATLDGVHHLDAVLDAEGGAAFAAVLDDIDHELWLADQGAARAAGREVIADPAQRRADALVEMARRAATAPDGGRRPRPLAHIVVGYDTYTNGIGAAMLNGEHPITPGRHGGCAATPTSPGSSPTPPVWSSTSARPATPAARCVTSSGPATAPAASRAARSAATRCDVHHIVAHHDGGPTRLDNLLSICDHHHRLIHEHGFGCEHLGHGPEIAFTRPDGSFLATIALTLDVAA